MSTHRERAPRGEERENTTSVGTSIASTVTVDPSPNCLEKG